MYYHCDFVHLIMNYEDGIYIFVHKLLYGKSAELRQLISRKCISEVMAELLSLALAECSRLHSMKCILFEYKSINLFKRMYIPP